MVLLQVVRALQTRCDELSVVNKPVLVRVDDLHRPLHITEVNLDLGAVLEPVNQLFNRQLPIAVEIDLGEDLSQQYNLVLRNPSCDQTQCCTLQLH